MKRALAWITLCLGIPSTVLAVSTKSFVIDTSDAFEKGKLEGTASHADGKLTRGVSTERTPIEGVPVAYGSTLGPDGAIYVGTGNEGGIYRVTKDGAKLFADTDAALITSLVWVDGTLYAGSLPKGRVLAIDTNGKVREHATLEGAEHVWGLAYDPKLRTLYAATGPEGKLFAIDASGKSKQIYDDMAEHLLCVDLDGEGRVYTGTSNGARVVRVSGGTASVLYDFPGQEVTALDVGTSFVAVASNEFPEPPSPSGNAGKDGLGNVARLKRPKPGKGKLFALGFDGHVAELYSSDNGHLSALEIEDKTGAVQVGLSQEGRIVRVTQNGERALWADVDERQIVGIHLAAETPYFVTSDGAAVYRTKGQAPEGQWTSAALDSKAPSRFGELTFRARGTVRFATRSGNTETPDASWSPWSAEARAAAPIRSPGGRFLQVRATLSGDAELYAVQAYYLPQNLPARVRNLRVKTKPTDAKPSTSSSPTPQLPLTWDIDNPDEDKLRHRLFYRREEHSAWLPMLREHELLDANEYSWDTRPIPDGFYRVRVETSDELSNPPAFVMKSETQSAPILVDNHAPELLELKIDKGKLAGVARDSIGPVSALELAVDGEPFRPFFPSDGLLDTREERFQVDLSSLASGTHIVAVRATDAGQNTVTQAVEFAVGR